MYSWKVPAGQNIMVGKDTPESGVPKPISINKAAKQLVAKIKKVHKQAQAN